MRLAFIPQLYPNIPTTTANCLVLEVNDHVLKCRIVETGRIIFLWHPDPGPFNIVDIFLIDPKIAFNEDQWKGLGFPIEELQEMNAPIVEVGSTHSFTFRKKSKSSAFEYSDAKHRSLT